MGLYEIGLHHVHSAQSVNKFELELQINPFETTNSCDRTLSSNKELISNLHISTIQKHE